VRVDEDDPLGSVLRGRESVGGLFVFMMTPLLGNVGAAWVEKKLMSKKSASDEVGNATETTEGTLAALTMQA
jgi:hypothetical protein